MRSGWQVPLASALAPLAVLGVLVAAVTAGATYAGGDATTTSGPPVDPDPSPTQEPVPDGFVAYAGDRVDGVRMLVPDGDGWELTDGFRGYEGGTGEAAVQVSVPSPAVYDADWCTESDEAAELAYVGYADPTEKTGDATAQQSATDVLADWTVAVGSRADGSPVPSSEPELAPVRLDDGTAAWTTSTVIATASLWDQCDVRSTEVRVVSVDVGESITNVVMVRLVEDGGSDMPDGLGAGDADAVLRSIDVQ